MPEDPTADPVAGLENENEELRLGLARLRAGIEGLRSSRSFFGRLDIWAAAVGAWLAIGPGPFKSASAWLEATSASRPIPKEETMGDGCLAIWAHSN